MQLPNTKWVGVITLPLVGRVSFWVAFSGILENRWVAFHCRQNAQFSKLYYGRNVLKTTQFGQSLVLTWAFFTTHPIIIISNIFITVNTAFNTPIRLCFTVMIYVMTTNQAFKLITVALPLLIEEIIAGPIWNGSSKRKCGYCGYHVEVKCDYFSKWRKRVSTAKRGKTIIQSNTYMEILVNIDLKAITWK